MKTFWMSFADPYRPKGEQFLGVVIIDANDFREAVILIHIMDLNPGGGIESVDIDVPNLIKDEWKNRLLSKEEAIWINKELNSMWKKIH